MYLAANSVCTRQTVGTFQNDEGSHASCKPLNQTGVADE